MSDPYTVMHRQIPWHPADGPDVLPLNRHVRHDSRSRRYPWIARGRPLQSVLHPRRVPILDQGRVGSCTGNAVTGALGTDPVFATMPAGTVLDEALALKIYSAAEVIDGDGPYPPQDNGSSGLSACQAAKAVGLLSGYLHAFSLAAVLDALQDTPLVTGVNWFDSFDSPDSSGLVTLSPGAVIRGGHELEIRGIDVITQEIFLDNSWGTSWGLNGSLRMRWVTYERLLSEQGDATVPVPLSQPAPVPVPPGASPAAIALQAVAGPWAASLRTRPDLVALQHAIRDWELAEGFTAVR